MTASVHALRQPRPTFPTGRPLTTAETDVMISEFMERLEQAHEELREAALSAAKCEAAYRVGHAREYLLCGHKTDAQRQAQATVNTAELLERRKIAEAEMTAAAELCRVRRAQLDAIRTLGVSARGAEQGH